MSSWRCPYCQQIATLTSSNISDDTHSFNLGNKDGALALKSQVIVCPNAKCHEYTISAWLQEYETTSTGNQRQKAAAKQTWRLKPDSAAKPLPDYVPKPILDDYKEACLIASLSPKASATLSRRCLQGMIRDFHGIAKNRLVDEIAALKGIVDAQTWDAIDAVRNLGNIGAHMEKDIDTIIEVDPNEAQLLIELIETLIEEWYVHRHARDKRMQAIVAVAAAKKQDKAQSRNDPEGTPAKSEE